ncbi:uncharacterized protein LOC130892333 [Diorhabda carinulata]|uniref:uncharacterized protein LOC130892333 n=1 Tax=Diorhabda carinulata TaxID=1163345 RepID=UPI0025A20668|nr:uncharacterized protein LOC130892333 [Diorhabda carinulata]
MYDNSMEHNENWKDSNKPIGIWTEDEKIKLDYLIQFIDEFISSQEYEDYMEKKRNIIKKNAETQYSQDDFIDLPSEEVETCKKYFPLTSNSKKMYAFIKKFEIYLKNKEHENIMQKQIKGIAIIRAKIEDVKKLTALSVNDIKRAREKELDEETKDFCKLYNIDFNKVRQENKKNIKEKIASHSRMLRIRYITRRENIANIARTILEEMRRNKKILERLNKTYDYKVTKNEWIIEDMVVVGTAMSLHKQETESNIVEEPSPVVVVEDNEIASPKKEKRDKGKKKTKKEAKADKVEKKVDKKVDKKDKKNKKVKKKEKDEKKKKGLKEKKSKKSKKGQPDDAIPIELTLSQEQQIAELNEQFEKFDEMMENQHMAKQSPEENYPIDRNFSCHPQTLLYNNYDIGKVYKRYFKIRNNSFMPRKFRFLKMITANEYDALLFELKPLIGIQKLVGGASISMLLTFTPTYKYEEIDAELIFLSFDDRTQSYQKFCVCVQCILKRANLQISSDHIYFGKIPFWQTSRCMKRLTFSNIGGEPCDIYIKKIKDTFDVEDEAITNVSNNDSTLELNDDLENQDVIRNVTSEIIENVLGNFHFTCTYIKLDSFETKAISIFLKNMDYYGSYIEKHLVEAYDENNKNFANFEVVTEAYITGPFISVFPEVLDYEICSINSVYQLPMDIKNSSSTTQAVAIKVPFSIKDYVKPDVINIYLPPMATRTVIIRLVLGKNIMNTIYFDKELSLLKLNIQVCILTKNYNEIPPVIATVYAVITVSNILSINPVDNTFVNYMSNCLILDVGKCTIFESVYTDIEVKNNSLIPQIYGFMDVPHWITIEPNYGFTEITPGSKQTYRVFVHPDYQDLLKNFDKKKTKDRCLTSVIRIETVNNTRAPNTFFDTKKLRKSIQFVLKEMNNSIDDVLKEDISDCMRLIKQTYFNNEESIILNPEGMTEISMYNDNEEENDSYEEEDNCNITQLMIKVEVMKPLVEVSFQHIELPDTPCGSYSVISFDIRALRFEFNQECELFRKKDMKLQKYEAWFKITGDNKEIRVEPSCGILKNGETMKIFLIATPNIPEYIVQETARSIKYSEIYEMKMKEIESNKHKKMRKNDKKKTKKGGKTKPKKSGKDKKGKKVDKKKTKKAASSTVEEKKEEEVEPEIIISDSEINVTYEDYFPSEMCYWRSMKPYTISSELTCVVTYNSDFFVRPKELINMNVYCRVVRPDFISNLKLQRVDFGNVAVGMSDNKNVIIQNIKYDTIEIKTNLLNPVGPFSVSYIKNPKIPGECYMNLPLKFSPKSNEFFEEYIEITSGTTVLPLILQGVGVDTKVTFSPDFLVCRLNKATTRTIEEYLLKIQNLSEAPVTFVFEKVFEIEGIVKSVPVVKKEQKKKKNDTKGDGDKASRKSKGSKKSKESNGSKVKGAKKFSDDLSPSEINSIPTFEPTKNTTYFDILNVEKNSLTLQKNATGIVKFGFGTKAILDETKMQLKEKKKKEKTKKAKSPRVDKGSEKNIDVQDKKMTHITKYNILLGANIYKEIILIGNLSQARKDSIASQYTLYSNIFIHRYISEMYNITKNVSSDFSQVDIGPMIGLIEKVVIMSARFKAFQKLKKLDETWKIIVNGQEDKPISLIIKGLVDVPSIEIGNKNEICLPTAQIDTVVTGNFNLKNTCHFNLSFTFYPNNHKFISMIPKTGDVLIGEEVSVTVVYHAEVCAPKVIEMYCKLHVKQKLDAIVGTDYDHYFTVNCEKAFSQLCATQISEEFNVVEYGSVIQTDFSLFNFGLSTVSFVLHIVRPMYNQDEIKLTPKSGNIDPGRQMQVNTINCVLFDADSVKFIGQLGLHKFLSTDGFFQ